MKVERFIKEYANYQIKGDEEEFKQALRECYIDELDIEAYCE